MGIDELGDEMFCGSWTLSLLPAQYRLRTTQSGPGTQEGLTVISYEYCWPVAVCTSEDEVDQVNLVE